MSKVAVLFQFRRAFPQERVGSDCAIPNRQFQKTAFSVSIPTGRCRGLRVLLPTEDGFPMRPFQFQFPAGSFKKRLFQFQFPAGSFKKGAMRGQK